MSAFIPSDDQEFPEIRASVRALCADFPGTYWRELDRERCYPEDFASAMTKAGFLAALIPETYGGSGLGIAEAATIVEEVHRSGGNAAACHAQMYMMGTVLRYGSEAQKKAHLPGIAAGDVRLQAFGVTEPTSGSDATRIRTTARRDGDGYIVDGQKVWTSRAEHSDLMLLLARTSPREADAKRHEGLSVFLIDMQSARGNGLTIRPIRTMINHATTEVFFDNLRIPADSLIGEEGKGFRYILSGMNAERILIAAECIGDAKWFLKTGAAYARERAVFGEAIGTNQGVQFPLARAQAHLMAAEAIVYRAAAMYDAGENPGVEANTAKLLASEASWEAGEACMQTHGGFAFAEEYDVERKWREARLYQTAPISKNMIFAYLGQHVLGLPRSY